jgi:hypothetical protein
MNVADKNIVRFRSQIRQQNGIISFNMDPFSSWKEFSLSFYDVIYGSNKYRRDLFTTMDSDFHFIPLDEESALVTSSNSSYILRCVGLKCTMEKLPVVFSHSINDIRYNGQKVFILTATQILDINKSDPNNSKFVGKLPLRGDFVHFTKDKCVLGISKPSSLELDKIFKIWKFDPSKSATDPEYLQLENIQIFFITYGIAFDSTLDHYFLVSERGIIKLSYPMKKDYLYFLGNHPLITQRFNINSLREQLVVAAPNLIIVAWKHFLIFIRHIGGDLEKAVVEEINVGHEIRMIQMDPVSDLVTFFIFIFDCRRIGFY